MKTTTILMGLIFFVTLFGCKENKNPITKNEFILIGEIDGIESDSWIYLMLDNEIVDSTKIVKNKFSISNAINHPKQYNLLVKNSRNYCSIWLESGEIEFKAKDGQFKDAIIQGSNSQKESEKLWKPVWEYRKQRDSLSKIVYNNELNDSLKLNAKLELKKIEQNKLKIECEFIKNNPNSYVSAETLDFYTTTLPHNRVFELYDNFSDDVKQSSYGKSIKRFLELYKDLKIGDKFVDFSMPNEDNKLVHLSDFEGKLILLEFWASWCGPCKKEYPALREAYSKFNSAGFEIVSVSEDQTKEQWLEAIKENKLSWINLWQKGGNDADPYIIYGISGIPSNFLIDENGIIIGQNLKGENLISKIEENLESKASR